MYTYHILFIHSSVDGHLVCLLVLTIVNSAAINMEVYVSFQIMISAWIYTMGYYSDIKKNEIMPLAAIWTDLELIILSETYQAKKYK